MPVDENNDKWAWYVVLSSTRNMSCCTKPNSLKRTQLYSLTFIRACTIYFCLTKDDSEPCIRGHRSSRCEHFDRFMVRVARPGRPLSTCPHPKNQCNCGKEKVMMIRIPKGKEWMRMDSFHHNTCLSCLPASACLCAPLCTAGQNGNPNGSSTSSASSAGVNPQSIMPSYSYPSASPQRIQRYSQRNGSVVVPELIARALRYEEDSNHQSPQVSSNSPGEASLAPTSHALSIPSPFEQATLYTVGTQTSSQDSGIGLRAHDVISDAQKPGCLQLGMLAAGGYREEKDVFGWSGERPSLHEPLHGEGNVSTPAQTSTRGCCSARHSVGPALPVALSYCCSRHSGPSNSVSPTFSHGVNAVRCPSCHSHRSDIEPTPYYYTQIPHHGLPMVHQHQPSVCCQHVMSHHPYHMDSSHTTLYTIPPSYATASHPLTAQQHAFLQQNPHLYAQTVPQHAPFGIISQVAPPAEATSQLTPAHNCNCGAGCECLGCAAHPFNATTRSHVQSLGAIIAHGEHDSMSNTHSPPSYDLPPDQWLSVHNMAPVLPHCYNPNVSSTLPTNPLSTQQPATTTTASSPWSPPRGNGVGGQQNSFLSSSYYTMEIPMDPTGPTASCTDVSGSCQCGDECPCIGCLTHTGHNGIPLDVPAD